MVSTHQEEEALLGPTSGQEPVGHVQAAGLLKRNLLGDPFVWMAQVGLALFAVVLWRVLYLHPAGLFSYHPSFQSVAIIGFAQGVLLLQPTKTAATKSKGLSLHQIFQYSALPILLVGASCIIYNKILHAAYHFTSWHGRLGITTLLVVLLQMIFGAFVVYGPLATLIGGEQRAKSLWKFHRVTGYVTLCLLFLTPFTAIQSDWIVGNTSKLDRLAMAAGLFLVAVGVFARISMAKLGFSESSARRWRA